MFVQLNCFIVIVSFFYPCVISPNIVIFIVLDFHPRILGLTGSHDQLHDVTRAFRVYHSPSPKDDDGDYLVIVLVLRLRDSERLSNKNFIT